MNRTDEAWRHLPLAWQWKNLIGMLLWVNKSLEFALRVRSIRADGLETFQSWKQWIKHTLFKILLPHFWFLCSSEVKKNKWFNSFRNTWKAIRWLCSGWDAIGFHKTNRDSNRGLSRIKVGTRLVFVKPTVIPTMGFNIRWLEHGWFSQN